MLRIDQVRKLSGGEWLTKLQWLSRGYVPDESKGKWFRANYDKSPYYYYCHVSNVVYDPERAKELLTLYDKMVAGMALPPPLEVYDGRPWWC